MSLQDAIARNRARQAAKTEGVPVDSTIPWMRAFTVNVKVLPTMRDVYLFGATVHDETKTIYGTSLADAKKRAGIE